jgi:hypothetical protein
VKHARHVCPLFLLDEGIVGFNVAVRQKCADGEIVQTRGKPREISIN